LTPNTYSTDPIMPSRRKFKSLFEEDDLGEYDIHEPSIDDIEDVKPVSESLRLYTPMILAPGHLEFELYSPSPMIINGITLWSASPIRIIGAGFPPPYDVQFELAASLNTFFAQGWMRLPDELKERILSYHLLTDNPVDE